MQFNPPLKGCIKISAANSSLGYLEGFITKEILNAETCQSFFQVQDFQCLILSRNASEFSVLFDQGF